MRMSRHAEGARLSLGTPLKKCRVHTQNPMSAPSHTKISCTQVADDHYACTEDGKWFSLFVADVQYSQNGGDDKTFSLRGENLDCTTDDCAKALGGTPQTCYSQTYDGHVYTSCYSDFNDMRVRVSKTKDGTNEVLESWTVGTVGPNCTVEKTDSSGSYSNQEKVKCSVSADKQELSVFDYTGKSLAFHFDTALFRGIP